MGRLLPSGKRGAKGQRERGTEGWRDGGTEGRRDGWRDRGMEGGAPSGSRKERASEGMRGAHRRDIAVVLAERRDTPQRHEPVVCECGRGFDLLPPAMHDGAGVIERHGKWSSGIQ
jgi:hypothetical protein